MKKQVKIEEKKQENITKMDEYLEIEQELTLHNKTQKTI